MIPRNNEEHMPKVLAFFEVSPDEKQVLVGGYEGEVSVLTLSTGEVKQVQESGEYNLMAAPVWRKDGEITYAKRNPEADGKKPDRKAEIVLRKGDEVKVLSQSWSDDMLEQIFPHSDKK
jgi:tricorn protease-like protein